MSGATRSPPSTTTPWPERVPRLLVVTVALACLAFTVYVGAVRKPGGFLHDLDLHYFFVGGVAWWNGDSAYSLEPFLRHWLEQFGAPALPDSSFVESGAVLPLSLTLGAMPWEAARVVMRGLNLGCLLATLLALRQILASIGFQQETRTWRELWIGLALLLPAVAQTLYQGQMALIMVFGLALSWFGFERRRTWLIAVGFMLAAHKPQAALVPLLFMIAMYRQREVWVAIAACAAYCLIPLLWTNPVQFATDLQESLAVHMHQEFNQPYNYDSVAGLLGHTSIARLALGVCVVAGCWLGLRLGAVACRSSDRTRRIRLLQLALAVTAVTMPLHRYDQTFDLILISTAWALGSTRRAVVLLGLVLAHGHGYWMGFHLATRLELATPWLQVSSHTNSTLGIVVLAFLTWCWIVDRRRLPPGEQR